MTRSIVLRYNKNVTLFSLYFMPAIRSTISFTQKNWKNIQDEKNRSKLVNTAVEYYLKAQNFLQEKEQEFILQELNHYEDTGESYSFDETFAEDK